MKSVTPAPRRATGAVARLGFSPTPADAPAHVAVSHVVTAEASLGGTVDRYAEWTVTRSPDGVAVRLRLGDNDARTTFHELLIADDNAGLSSSMSPDGFRRFVAALNAAAVALDGPR